MTKYKIIAHQSMEHSAKVDRRMINRPTNVSLDDPAVTVMTDLHDFIPFSIEPTASIDAANEKMIACGVRLLFVTESNGDLLGIVTFTDVLGEKPLKLINERGVTRAEITTEDVMTRNIELQVMRIQDVENASVGDLIETMRTIDRQHTLVVETNSKGRETIRGIFSTSQIERQTGIELAPSLRVKTFAEVEKVVMSV